MNNKDKTRAQEKPQPDKNSLKRRQEPTVNDLLHSSPPVESHPLPPFLPENSRVVFLGSFPPQKKRWCMDFYYPNFNNDHWRIEGLIWFNDKNHFIDLQNNTFRLDSIIDFLNERGIGFYDTATAVRRWADNASDKFLEIVRQTDLDALVAPLRQLKALAVTGEKACEALCSYYAIKEIPKTGAHLALRNGLTLYRLPSSSRAYPLSLDAKAKVYKNMFADLGML